MSSKKILWIATILVILFISVCYKSLQEGFTAVSDASFGVLPVSAAAGANAVKVLDETLPQYALCIQKPAGEKGQCKKGFTCKGNRNQYGNCLL